MWSVKKKGVCASESRKDKGGSFLEPRQSQNEFGPDLQDLSSHNVFYFFAFAPWTSGRIKELE